MERPIEFLKPSEVDKILRLPQGRAAKLARRGWKAGVVLPDGTVRFSRKAIERLAEGQRAELCPDSS
jgi:hypothetical protein